MGEKLLEVKNLTIGFPTARLSALSVNPVREKV